MGIFASKQNEESSPLTFKKMLENWAFISYARKVNQDILQENSSSRYHDSMSGSYAKTHATNYSQKAIKWLNAIMEDEGVYIMHAENGGECMIPGTSYSVDGYCKDTNTVYEFYGDYWHGNPYVYESDAPSRKPGKTMGDLYQSTMKRERKIKALGYDVVSIWESEYDVQNAS